MDNALSEILLRKEHFNRWAMNFVDKKISFNRAVALLAKNGIQIDDNEAAVILNFLYLVAKNYQYDSNLDLKNLNEKSNCQKVH